MQTMTSRERVDNAIGRQPVDRLPVAESFREETSARRAR